MNEAPYLNEFLKERLEELEKKEIEVKIKNHRYKKNYKDGKCLSLQVFLEKELVSEFKELVKLNGDSQAEVIRQYLKDYVLRCKKEML